MADMLIVYNRDKIPDDPDFEKLTYGDQNDMGRKIARNVKKGDYVFFQWTPAKNRYTKAYFCVDDVLTGRKIIEQAADNGIIDKGNTAITEGDDVVIIGNRHKSKVCSGNGVLFDVQLGLSLGIVKQDYRQTDDYGRHYSELEIVNHFTHLGPVIKRPTSLLLKDMLDKYD